MSTRFRVSIAVDVMPQIEAWRDRYVSTVGIAKYRRAAGWTVDEVAKHAVVGIRQQFDKHLRRNTPWTQSAIKYQRSTAGGLNAIEAVKADGLFSAVYVMPKQSTYLKYLFGLGDNTRLPGDVGLAQRHILIPWWQNITLTQGVQPTRFGGVPTGFLARLAREVQGTRAPKRSGTQNRWGVYFGEITLHGQKRLAYVARPPRVATSESMYVPSREGGMRRIGQRMIDPTTRASCSSPSTGRPTSRSWRSRGRRPARRRPPASPRSWLSSSRTTWPTRPRRRRPGGAWRHEPVRKSGHASGSRGAVRVFARRPSTRSTSAPENRQGAGGTTPGRILDGQSVVMKYLMGDAPTVRLPGDVGLARERILVPNWRALESTQGIHPNRFGNLPGGVAAGLKCEAAGTVARRCVRGRWGAYEGELAVSGSRIMGHIARPRAGSDLGQGRPHCLAQRRPATPAPRCHPAGDLSADPSTLVGRSPARGARRHPRVHGRPA